MARGIPVLFHEEYVFGAFTDCIETVAATGVAMDTGFTCTYAAGDITEADGFGGEWLFTWTVADEEYISAITTQEIFEFILGKPIRFAVELTPGLTADTPEELNLFIGCMENMDTASEFQTAGAGMRALCGDLFGFFTPESVTAVFPNPEVWHVVTGHNDILQYTPLIAGEQNNISHVDWKVYDPTSGNGITRKFVAEWMPLNVVPGVGGLAPTIIDAEVRYWIDGVLVAKHRQNGLIYFITIATTQAMNFGVVGMNAAASSVTAALDLDYQKCEQVR